MMRYNVGDRDHLTTMSDERRRIVALIAECIWVNPITADIVSSRRKGWLGRLADGTGVRRLVLRRVISDMGNREFEALLAGNPVGDAPVVVLSDSAMASTYGSCLHGTGTCGSCLHQTGTCGTCATCYAPEVGLMN
ncbi:hypothetical protein R75483_06320 [Paraburkholderia domus]|nr:hypothetical protein R75483_06320 [Paraburkholderia domus]